MRLKFTYGILMGKIVCFEEIYINYPCDFDINFKELYFNTYLSILYIYEIPYYFSLKIIT